MRKSSLILLTSCLGFTANFFCGNHFLDNYFTTTFSCESQLYAGEMKTYRTDHGKDKSLPWLQPVPGEFPPEDAAHYVSGELISVDHVERTFSIRVDRQDGRQGQDEALEADMLPYGSIFYHGSPASIRDIPLGTHLHGLFFIGPEEARFWVEKNGKQQPKVRDSGRPSAEVDFTNCFRLEDDFSFHAKKNQLWKIDKLEDSTPEKEDDLSHRMIVKHLTATLQENGQPIGKPQKFDLMQSTNVFQKNGFASLAEIKPGQLVQMNLTWATLFGPGRVTDIWLDEESRNGAASRQLKRHHRHIREHGLPGWIAAVNDKERIVTITFFDGVDLTLFEDLPKGNPKPLGWPTKEYDWGNDSPKGNIVVVRECLMSYDQVNDRKGGNILKIEKVPVQPGCSGVQIQVKCGILLEGFRPTKIVRFFPATWPVGSLPKEERYHGRE